jgi:hypothetical protein
MDEWEEAIPLSGLFGTDGRMKKKRLGIDYFSLTLKLGIIQPVELQSFRFLSRERVV